MSCVTSLIIVVLGILLGASIYINWNFYTHYLRDPNYPCIYYTDIDYRSGDLLFFRSVLSFHSFFSGEEMTHTGVVLEINKKLYLLELTTPNVKLTPLFERLSLFKDGWVFYKKLRNPIPIPSPETLERLQNLAKNIEYPKTLIESAKIRFSKTNLANPDVKMDCSRFALYVLKELGILHESANPNFKVLTWLNNMNDTYHPTQQISFFDETCRKDEKDLYSFTDAVLDML